MFGMDGSLAPRSGAGVTGCLSDRPWLTRQLGVATLRAMFQRLRPSSVDATPDRSADTDDARPERAADAGQGRPAIVAPDLAALPIAGLTRRRMAALVGAVLAAWIIIVFARQVGEASAATTLAERIAIENVGRQGQVAALERELELIARPRYIAQQARAYGLGTELEIPFALAPDAPALPPDAPGSAAVRVGAAVDAVSPLERWLTVLFGPAD